MWLKSQIDLLYLCGDNPACTVIRHKCASTIVGVKWLFQFGFYPVVCKMITVYTLNRKLSLSVKQSHLSNSPKETIQPVNEMVHSQNTSGHKHLVSAECYIWYLQSATLDQKLEVKERQAAKLSRGQMDSLALGHIYYIGTPHTTLNGIKNTNTHTITSVPFTYSWGY